MEKQEIEKAIKETLARFDVFDFPLTDFELWQFLNIKISYKDLRDFLKDNKLIQKEGFYFLENREGLIATRQNRYREANKKVALAYKRIKLISWLPWIKLICLANIIGPHNLKRESDLDLFIVTKDNRLWLTKLIATVLVALMHWRPTEQHSADKLCLSFLVDETSLDLNDCLINEDDWYFSYWLAGLRPLYGDEATYQKLLLENAWLNKNLPNWQSPYLKIQKFFNKKPISKKSFAIFNIFEKMSKRINYFLMSEEIKTKANKTTEVIVSDNRLKLHTLDRRLEIFKRAEEKLNS